VRLLAFALALTFVAKTALALECADVHIPRMVVICSDPELTRLADERQVAVNEMRGRIGEDRWPAFWATQQEWVRSYSQNCGVPDNRPPPSLPVSNAIKECFRQAAIARLAFIKSYGLPSGTAPPANDSAPSTKLNCARAVTITENVLCSNPTLRAADDAMARAYDALYLTLPSDQRAGLLADQRLWVRQRDKDCEYSKADADFVSCLVSVTRFRLKLLSLSPFQFGDGPKLQPQLYHDAHDSEYWITVFYPRIEQENSPGENRVQPVHSWSCPERSGAEKGPY
jgi:uncharacterized protein